MAFWPNASKICTNDLKMFFCKLINMSIKKHELYPDFKFVDAGVKKCVKKSFRQNG